MNAANDTLADNQGPPSPAAPRALDSSRRIHPFATLLRREYWEHKGGFVWAPAVAGIMFLLFSILGGTAGQIALQDKLPRLTGQSTGITGLDWAQMMGDRSPQELQQYKEAINGALLVASIWPFFVFGFVVFFYFLGTLYDERRDRSVLFWKSLPVSDGMTVLSKLTMGMVVAPLLAIAVGLLTMLGLIALICLLLMINGIPVSLFVSSIDPILLLSTLLAGLPVYILWSLPTVGWLLLCSAWARSKPFLWAMLIPLATGVLISIFDLLRYFNLQSGWFWTHIVARLLTSAWPGSHLVWDQVSAYKLEHAEGAESMLMAISGFDLLLSPQLWIGVIVGAGMIYLATRLRRWRDDG